MKKINVVGAVIIKDDKILCAQRGPKNRLPYKWEFPGGKIENNESPKDALKREIMEELNCSIKVNELIEHTIHEYDFGIVQLSTYYCEIVEGKPMKKEHIELRWVSKDNLLSLDFAPADIPSIKTIMKE